MPTPYRRCFYIDKTGQQCEKWFPAIDSNKLCPNHRELISPSALNLAPEESKVKYIDLVNEQREYCYHFKDGTAQKQGKELIYQFKDDAEGTVFDKLDAHIAFLEKVIEDVKARTHSARAVRREKLDELTEEQREERRKYKVERAVKEPREKVASFKSDPTAALMKRGLNQDMAKSLLTMDPDEFLEKFRKAKENKGE